MNCKNCGFPLEITDRFCKNCGTPVSQEPKPSVDYYNQPVVETQPVQTQVMDNNPVQQPMVETQPVVDSVPIQPVSSPSVMNTPSQPSYVQQPVQTPPMMNTNVPPIPQQPSYNQPYDNTPKKKSNAGVVIIVILIVLGMLVGGYFGIKVLLTNINGLSFLNGNEEEETVDVEFGDYTFAIPTDYNYEKTSYYLDVLDRENTWQIKFTYMGQLMDLESMVEDTSLLDNMKLIMESGGDTIVSDLEIGTINDLLALVFQFTKEIDGEYTKTTGAYVAISDEETIIIAIQRTDNEYDYDKLEEAINMIKE